MNEINDTIGCVNHDCAKCKAQSAPVQEPTRYEEVRDALEMLMRWQVKNVHVWHNGAYDYAAAVLKRHDSAAPEKGQP
jgi:hypothetical protein